MTAAAPDARSAHEIVTALRTELTALAERLARPAAPPGGLHLSAVECDRLAEALGLGAAVTASAILTAVDRLAAVRIGDIRIPFTPGQLAELQHRAAKRGRTVEAEMRAVVARIENELFYQGG